MYSKKLFILIVLSVCVLFIVSGLMKGQENKKHYNKAIDLLEKKDFESALETLDGLDNYKDANSLIEDAEKGVDYLEAVEKLENGEYQEAIKMFSTMLEFEDSKNQLASAKYGYAIQCFNEERYDEARQLFEELGDYEDSESYLDKIDVENLTKLRKSIYADAKKLYKEEQFSKALEKFNSILEYKNSKKWAEKCELQLKRRNLDTPIAVGTRYSMAVFNATKKDEYDGTAQAVGDGTEGQCDLGSWKNIKSIDGRGSLTIGLTEKGKVKVAGSYDGKKLDTKNWKKSIDIAAGTGFVLTLDTDHVVHAYGHGDDGQLEAEGWEDIIAIDAGWRFSVGLTSNHELKFAGHYGDMKDSYEENRKAWKDVVNISASGGDTSGKNRGMGHVVGLRSDGTVVAIGDNSWNQCQVADWKDIVAISAGDWYTVGLKDNGTIKITKDKRKGSKYIEEDIIEEINAKSDVVAIAAGYGLTLCLHSNGDVSAFGFNKDNGADDANNWKNVKLPKY